MKRSDPFLRLVPWRIYLVFSPIESVLSRLEIDGTVEADGDQIVFKKGSEYYDLPAALRGVIEFHQIAEQNHELPVDVAAMTRFANKLDAGAPIFESDIDAVRRCIASCKTQASKLRVSQAESILRTVQISAEMDRMNRESA